MNKKVANATKWSVVTELAAKMVSPIVNMILAHLLTPNAFGAVATITMIISFAEIFTDAGFQKYIVQHEFKDDKDFDESVNVAFWSNFSISILFVVFIWIFRHWIAGMTGSESLGNGIGVASVSILIVAFSSIQMAVYRRKFDFKTLFYVRVIITLIPLVVTVPLALFFRNYWALLIGTLCRDLVQAVVLTLKSEWKPRFFYSIEKFKEMFSFTAWTLLESISIWIATYAGTFIIGKSLSDYYLGLYKTSISTVNSYTSLITGGITPVMFSALSRVQNDHSKLKDTYFQFQKMVAIILVPLSVGMYIYRDLIVEILLGNQWIEASNFLGIYGMTNAITIIFGSYASEVYRSKGKPKVSLVFQIIHILFIIPIYLICLRGGFEGMSNAIIITRIQYVLTAIIILQFYFKIEFINSLKSIFSQIISAVIMGMIAILIKDIFSGIIWEFVSVGICILVYFAILLMFPEMRKTIFGIGYVKKIFNKLRRK